MRPLKSWALSTAALIVAACVAPVRHESAPVAIANYNFDYAITDREAVQLIQAFDDGHRTYLQFTSTPSAALEVRTATGETLTGSVDGNYLALDRVYGNLTVNVGARSAQVRSDAVEILQAAAKRDHPEGPKGDDSERAATLKTEIDSLQARIAELQAQLALARAAGRNTVVEIGAGLAAPRVVVRFRDRSSVVEIDDAMAKALGATAATASRVTLRGRTDAYNWSATASELAMARAIAVKRLLVAHGVEAQRIRVFYRGAGAFAVSNATASGKAANRRVEIDMISG